MSGSLILGFFDGVHIAHRVLISSALNYSKSSTLITFIDSPAVYFGKEKEYILSREESVKRIKALGVKNVIELDFPKIANMQAKEYLEYLIKDFSPDAIFTGFNHTFGLNKEGTPKILDKNQSKYGYKYFCVEPQKYEGEVISSSLIKKYIKNGEIEKANILLGNKFFIDGTVIEGAKIGRNIGFPTANIMYPDSIVKLPFGVYKVLCEGKNAILNWGMRPTVHNIKEPVAEVHILGFEGDLYGKRIRVEIIKQIRSEKCFSNLEELKRQIKEDISACCE